MRRRRTGIGWLGGLLVDLVLLAALASFAFGSSDSKLYDEYYVDEIELNVCGEVGFESSYYIYRDEVGLVVAWSSGVKSHEPKRSADGRWIAIVTVDDRQVIVHANWHTWSRTSFDVELFERDWEGKIGHKRHNFERRRKAMAVVPPAVAP